MSGIQATTNKEQLRVAVACAAAIGVMLSVGAPAMAGRLADGARRRRLRAGWAGHWLVRARATYLLMEGDVDKCLHRSGGPLLSSHGGVLPGDDADVTNQLIPELDISYFVNNNSALEAICCVTKHSVTATGALGDTINAVTGTGRELASTWAIPATILAAVSYADGRIQAVCRCGSHLFDLCRLGSWRWPRAGCHLGRGRRYLGRHRVRLAPTSPSAATGS